MTQEARDLLTWISRAPRTRAQVRYLSPPQYRKMINLALDELLSAGYVVRNNDGWLVPANKPSQR